MTAADVITVVVLAAAVFLLLFGESLCRWLEARRDRNTSEEGQS